MSNNEFKDRISRYSLIELIQSLSGLDAEKYPERQQMLQEAIQAARQKNEIGECTPSQELPSFEYAGFWQRIGSYFIDLLVLSPYLALTSYLANKFLYYYIYGYLPGLMIGFAFSVLLVVRYEATPGKLAMKIKIKMIDGSRVTTKAAVIRYLPLLIISAIVSFAFVVSCSTINEATYYSLGFLDKNKLLVANAPSWYGFVNILMNAWIWAEFITLLFNKRKRSIHDFIAGTIVVKEFNQKEILTGAPRQETKQDFPMPLNGAGS